MKIVKRVKRSILFYWKKNMLFLSIFTIMYSALFIIILMRENIDEMIYNVGKNIDTILEIRVEDAAAYSYDETIYYSKQNMEKLKMLEDVSSIEYISMANVKGENVEAVFSELQALYMEDEYLALRDENKMGEITVIGIDNILDAWDFKEREVEIRRGIGLSDLNKNEVVAVVSERFLKWNYLNIGDEIRLTNALDNSKTISLEIIGTHSGNEDYGDMAANPMNYIYIPLKQCLELNGGMIIETIIKVKNPQKIDAVIKSVESVLDDVNNKKFTIQKNYMEYLTAIIPLEGVKKVCNVMLLVVLGLFVLISYLLINNYMTSKRKEQTIWFSLGEKKWKNFIQTEMEFLLLAGGGGIIACIIIYSIQNLFEKIISSYLVSIPNFEFYITVKMMCAMVSLGICLNFCILSLLYFINTKKDTANFEV